MMTIASGHSGEIQVMILEMLGQDSHFRDSSWAFVSESHALKHCSCWLNRVVWLKELRQWAIVDLKRRIWSSNLISMNLCDRVEEI